jgi:hypothetical protein
LIVLKCFFFGLVLVCKSIFVWSVV